MRPLCARFVSILRQDALLSQVAFVLYYFKEMKGGLYMSTLTQLLESSNRVVFLGGAGVSTESGIPDFRSATGLYQDTSSPIPPETIISHSFFMRHPDTFYAYYRDHLCYPDAHPGPAHWALADLEHMGKLLAIITQNIDGLHQAAGSQRVLELHGSVHRNYCMQCHKHFDLAYILSAPTITPMCDVCGGMIRPDVVLYEEPLDQGVLHAAVESLAQADLLIVAGTSLTVYPAAGLIDYYGGKNLVLINRTPTPYDSRATLVLHEDVGPTLHQAVSDLR